MRSLIHHIIALSVCIFVPALLFIGYYLIGSVSTSSYESLQRQWLDMLLVISYVAALHALILGMPLYLLVRRYAHFTYKISAISGFLVGFLPVAIFAFPLRYASTPGSSASVNGVVTMSDGVTTLAGWLSYLQGAMVFGAMGLAAALVFKFLLVKLTNS